MLTLRPAARPGSLDDGVVVDEEVRDLVVEADPARVPDPVLLHRRDPAGVALHGVPVDLDVACLGDEDAGSPHVPWEGVLEPVPRDEVVPDHRGVAELVKDPAP